MILNKSDLIYLKGDEANEYVDYFEKNWVCLIKYYQKIYFSKYLFHFLG